MRLASAVTLSAMLACGLPTASYGQGRCEALKAPTDDKVGVKITALALQRDLLVQFIVTNDSNEKLYLKSAQWDEGARAFLSSGAQISTAMATGIETTKGFAGHSCLRDPSCSQDLNTFSAIDAKQSMRFAYRFTSMNTMTRSDEISFTVAMVARFARPTDQDDQAGPPRMLRFSFNSVPLNC